MSDDEREERHIEPSSEKKPKVGVTLNYETVAASYLNKINTFARSKGFDPIFKSYNDYKDKSSRC